MHACGQAEYSMRRHDVDIRFGLICNIHTVRHHRSIEAAASTDSRRRTAIAKLSAVLFVNLS